MTRKILSGEVLLGSTAVLAYLALVKLLLHFLFNGRYGYFRDELYFLACGDHLDWGYVDQPPLIAIMAIVTRTLLGDSLFALRFFPAVAGALTVFLAGLIARELGGGRFAQVLAATSVIVAPVYLGQDNLFTMNAFEHLFWALGAYVIILIVKRENPKLWLWFGLIAGIGLQNKISMLFFGFGVAVAIWLTPQRKHYLSKWFWLGGLIAFVIFLPYVIWQFQHDWAMLELLHRGQLYKNYPTSPSEFLLGQIIEVHPFNFPIWVAGLAFFLLSKEGKEFRVLGWTYLVIFVVFVILKAKAYYLAPIYPMLLAAGAVAIEAIIRQRLWNWLKPVAIGFLAVGGVIAAPFALPVLPVETFIKYQDFIGIRPAPTERHKSGKLPQHYADMFGWENMVEMVAKVYNRLPPEERAKCAVVTGNYGEAGAIDFFGKKYGLPKALSGHNNYWIWGPRGYSGEIAIILGASKKDVQEFYDQIEVAAIVVHEYAMPYESDLPVFICRKPKRSLQEAWPLIKDYI